MSKSLKGREITWDLNPNGKKKRSQTHRRNLGRSLRGRKFSTESRKKMSVAHKGEKSNLWKGGVSKENELVRKSLDYRLWRTAVFMRDDYTCQECGERSRKGNRVELHAHHIKPFSTHPDLRFAIDNGKTLCIECHRNTDTFAGKLQMNPTYVKN